MEANGDNHEDNMMTGDVRERGDMKCNRRLYSGGGICRKHKRKRREWWAALVVDAGGRGLARRYRGSFLVVDIVYSLYY